MVKLTFQIDDQTAETLRRIAASEGKTIEEIATDVINRRFSGNGKGGKPPLPLGMGEFHSGDPTIAERTEEILDQAVESGEWP